MTQTIAVTGIPPQRTPAIRPEIQTSIEPQGFSLQPCSRIRGRERWYVAGLKGNQRLAYTVEVALKREPGVEEAVANPLTGRVLVRYLPEHMQASVEMLIRQALALDLMSEPPIGSALSRPAKHDHFLLPKRLLLAELGCSSLKFLLLRGVWWPVGAIGWAAALVVALGLATQRSA